MSWRGKGKEGGKEGQDRGGIVERGRKCDVRERKREGRTRRRKDSKKGRKCDDNEREWERRNDKEEEEERKDRMLWRCDGKGTGRREGQRKEKKG